MNQQTDFSEAREAANFASARIVQEHAPWFAAYTWAHHEKQVASQLKDRRIECFLPFYRAVHRWKDRRKELDIPLFPGYVFVQHPPEDRLRVLQVPGVVRFVSFGGCPAPVDDAEIESLRSGIGNGVRAEPHPYLKIGRRVRVKHGPMAGTEGILVRKKDQLRVVISVELIMRSVAVEIEAADLG